MNVNTWLIDMPPRVKGHTVKNEDDSYSVFINARISHEDRIKTYKHEIQHILEDDFKKCNVEEIESRTHK